MSEVVSLQAFKEEREPHLCGPVKCLACGFETELRAPVGPIEADCTECGSSKLVHKQFVGPEEGTEIMCCSHCDETLFTIQMDWTMMCAGCGVTTREHLE